MAKRRRIEKAVTQQWRTQVLGTFGGRGTVKIENLACVLVLCFTYTIGRVELHSEHMKRGDDARHVPRADIAEVG